MLSLILALFAVSLVSARCPDAQLVKIESDGDVQKYFDETCLKYNGSISVGSKVQSLLFEYLVQVTGDFTVVDAVDLKSISAPKLKSIDGIFSLKGCTVLKKLELSGFISVGSFRLQTLPALESLGFKVTAADDVLITDTQLYSVDDIDLKSCKNFEVNNNRSLKTINLRLGSVEERFDINSNGKVLKITLPDLQTVNNITIRDATSISMPVLESINSSASFINYGSDSIVFPQLTSVGGSFSFATCERLTNITALKLKEIGGTFLIANNTNLEEINGFPKLTKVGGSVDMAGKFVKVVLKALEDVRGSFNLQTTAILDCSPFDALRDNDVVKGEYICEDKKEKASALTADGLDTTGSGSGSGKSSAPGHVTISSIGVTIVALAIALTATVL
jgi:hypothetical protein